MQTECIPDLFDFQPAEGRSVVAAFDGGAVSSDAGALSLGQTDRAIGLIERFAGCFTDHRDARLVEHEVKTLVGQRVVGIALGYEDLNLNVLHPPKSPRHYFRKCDAITVPTDLAFAGEAWSSVHDALPLVTVDSGIAPEELAQLLRAAFFSPSDDADADSWETQLTRFEEDALHPAMSLRLDCRKWEIYRCCQHASRGSFPFIEKVFADSGYASEKVATDTVIAVEIVRKSPDQVGFAVQPRRWVVERFFAWINRNRRLAKDFEASIASARAFLYAASVMLLVRRLARAA